MFYRDDWQLHKNNGGNSVVNPAILTIQTSLISPYASEIRQEMYSQRNTEARSCNHCCSGKAPSITYSECVCVCGLRYPACSANVP